MSIREGEILSTWLDNKKWNAYDLAEKIEVSPQAVYAQVKADVVSDSFKLKLIMIGEDIFGLVPDSLKIKQEEPVNENELIKDFQNRLVILERMFAEKVLVENK